jgi:hypothetical protein
VEPHLDCRWAAGVEEIGEDLGEPVKWGAEHLGDGVAGRPVHLKDSGVG